MVIGMSIAVGYTSDSLVVAQILGQETVAQYSVPYRLFSIVTVVLTFFLMPLWPAYAEAAARGDVFWIRRTLRRSLKLGLAFNLTAGLLLVVSGRWIIRLWVGPEIVPSIPLLVAFGSYLIVNCVHGPLSILLNGLSVLGFQLVCWISMAVLNLALSIVLTRRFGVSGVVFGTVVANLVCFVIPSAWYVRRHLRRLTIEQQQRQQQQPTATTERPASEPALLTADPSAIPPAG
jgi:O-antigen/teichoic acid export membrane protein